ncbi:MAG TPA: hypothetical protein VMR52_01810 [Dehalococcoidia bacterium]|nr:hypothetical protein [Dehalococcoidia bacterium]
MTNSGATVETNAQTPEPKQKREYSEMRFPAYDIVHSVGVAKAIHEKGGGTAKKDQLAAYLNYKSVTNGAFLSRIAAAERFGLIEKRDATYAITARAQKILMPVYPAQVAEALVEAFLAVPLFRAVYDEFYGGELPPEFGLKNALRIRFGVIPSRVDVAYRTLMESADAAGFFSTRGSRSQLIIPTIVQPSVDSDPPPADDPDESDLGGGGSDDEPPDKRSRTLSMDQLKGQYVATLIDLLREKGRSGEFDASLAERIEKLLAIEVATGA